MLKSAHFDATNTRPTLKLYRRLLAFVRPFRLRLAAAVLASLCFAAATALYAWLIGPLLKMLLTGEASKVPGMGFLSGLDKRQMLLALPVCLVAVALFRAASQAIQTYLMGSTGQLVVASIRRALYARFISLPQAWMDRQHSGDLIARFSASVQAVEQSLTVAFSSYVRDTLQVAALLLVCAFLDWRLLAAAVSVAPVTLILVFRFTRRLRSVTVEAQELQGKMSGQVGEAAANIRIVQAFCGEEGELSRFDAMQERYVSRMSESLRLRGAISPTVESLGVFGLAALIFFAGSPLAGDDFAPEALLSFIAALMLMYRPLKDLAHTGQQVVQGEAGAERIFEVLDAQDALSSPEHPAPAAFEETIAFEGVGFAYSTRPEAPALTDLSLSLAKGKSLAVVGESGSGKSTLASLLLRFYDPTAGRITSDGRDIREFALDDWRSLFAYVPQEPVLFQGTIAENVCAFRSGISEEAIIEALKAANAWDFVEQMGGIGAEVGERGQGLSGGQKQRISIARAFLTLAPILILDEATSALDSAGERLVQAGIERLMQGRTSLVIAHRLTTIERCDAVAVLDRGHLAELGSHAELLSRGGIYARLWKAQMSSPEEPRAVSEPVLKESAVPERVS